MSDADHGPGSTEQRRQGWTAPAQPPIVQRPVDGVGAPVGAVGIAARAAGHWPAAGRWPAPPDTVPSTRCRFALGPPRNFLYPAVLLLLAEEPSHGYRLGERLVDLGFGRADRPSIYRVLADLERDRLVRRRPDPTAAATQSGPGTARHVYEVTDDGLDCLQAWMSVIAQERDGLDVVLRRYWYTNAQRLGEIDGTAPAVSDVGPVPVAVERFAVAPDRSTLVVQARSNVGPIAFSGSGMIGSISVAVDRGVVADEPAPRAQLVLPLRALTSGNALYDRELLRRVDARRYPEVSVQLTAASRIGDGNCYLVAGTVAMHGAVVELDGVVRVAVVDADRRTRTGTVADRRLDVSGEQMIDISAFGMDVPAMAVLRLYPDVRLSLHVEADRID